MHYCRYYSFTTKITSQSNCIEDGYYAIPADFVTFCPETGAPILPTDEEGGEIIPNGFLFLSYDFLEADRILALRQVTDDWETYITYQSYAFPTLIMGSMEWLVLTDSEADKAQDESFDSYIEECLEIPDIVRRYFDDEAWKRDARLDGRGHCLASYDGDEQEYVTGSDTYFLYRTN